MLMMTHFPFRNLQNLPLLDKIDLLGVDVAQAGQGYHKEKRAIDDKMSGYSMGGAFFPFLRFVESIIQK